MRATKYLVDGVPMSFHRQTRGYWYGYFRQRGKQCKRYFGKDDPRPRYAVYVAPPPPMGLTWLHGGLRRQLRGEL